ncbi:GNAT family N-acetyltransferase [Paraburkholderia hayleyella]|uniref:GNAT family N-acetyltransferase n=1 Tax=Paraburkholderia hayleyella TaxID=2152889 RepID=UPI00129218C8|nr:GNAT family N-acetyltransferase [Paraburkholderia hayleyella]
MQVYVFKDRSGRVIRVVFDTESLCALAYRDDEIVGVLRVENDAVGAQTSVRLLSVYVEPAYRRCGIAHTLLAYVCRETGQSIEIAPVMASQSLAFAHLCRCLMQEGVIVAA